MGHDFERVPAAVIDLIKRISQEMEPLLPQIICQERVQEYLKLFRQQYRRAAMQKDEESMSRIQARINVYENTRNCQQNTMEAHQRIIRSTNEYLIRWFARESLALERNAQPVVLTTRGLIQTAIYRLRSFYCRNEMLRMYNEDFLEAENPLLRPAHPETFMQLGAAYL